MPSPILAIDELVEIAAKMGFADAVIGAEGPSLDPKGRVANLAKTRWTHGRIICAAILPTTLG